MATSRLMAASDRMSGIATTVTNQFDIRELGPMADHDLRPALTVPLQKAGIRYHPEAIDSLLRAANGDPSRLRALADTAVGFADPTAGITSATAAAATARVNDESAVLYQGRWNRCTDAQKDLLAKVAAQGPNGLSMPAANDRQHVTFDNQVLGCRLQGLFLQPIRGIEKQLTGRVQRAREQRRLHLLRIKRVSVGALREQNAQVAAGQIGQPPVPRGKRRSSSAWLSRPGSARGRRRSSGR
jgi:hypothetical protein